MKSPNSFHTDLYNTIDEYVHAVYDYSQAFPRSEIFGLTSQLRRSAISVMLNYIEGYARQRKPVLKHFLEISFGSLKESMYIFDFAYKRNYLSKYEYTHLQTLADRIGSMLWGIIKKL